MHGLIDYQPEMRVYLMHKLMLTGMVLLAAATRARVTRSFIMIGLARRAGGWVR